MRTAFPPGLELGPARFLACLDVPADCESPSAGFHAARALLETLALSTEETAVVRNRLENARKYLEAGERGAAHFKFRLLRGTLTNE